MDTPEESYFQQMREQHPCPEGCNGSDPDCRCRGSGLRSLCITCRHLGDFRPCGYVCYNLEDWRPIKEK